ncbi:MAG: DUF3365 domain-containing protein, partial [Planctomycetota bacterium]|nr:DUF3365 domain-containing protein [Planctomycetota bacterium]
MSDTTRNTIARVRDVLSQIHPVATDWACRRTGRVMLLAGAIAFALVYWQLSQITRDLVQNTAVRTAEFYSTSLQTFRTLYMSEVVVRAKTHGMQIRHDYKDRDDAIPLPATLNILLANQIGEEEHRTSARFYNAFSLPGRDADEPETPFEHAARAALAAIPDKPFYRFEETAEGDVLHYAISDRVQASCVSCHQNGDPRNAEFRWREGDVWGVVHVSVPVDDSVSHLNADIRHLCLLVIGSGGAGIFGVVLVLRKLRSDADRMAASNRLLAEQKSGLVHAQQRLVEANESIRKRAVEQQQMQLAAINILKDTARGRQQLEQTNQQLASLQNEHLETARRAGMAEVATGVLHNVGNVLNSVNVSANLLTDRLITNRIDNLRKAVLMLEEHSDDPGSFLTCDEKGRRLPAYLRRLSDSLTEDREFMQAEVRSLGEKIDHIKEVVKVQQSFATYSGHLELVALSELVEVAVKVNEASLGKHRVEIQCDFDDTPMIQTDRHRVLQILVNLIGNAKNAINEHDGDVRRITICTKQVKDS